MATNHTTNYALNLWESTDKFVREEFNQDNTKIDAALRNRLKPEVISTYNIEGKQTEVNIDFSELNWNEWLAVGFMFSESDTRRHLYVMGYDKDGNTIRVSSNCNSWGGINSGGVGALVFLPLFDQERRLTFYQCGHKDSKVVSGLAYSSIPFAKLDRIYLQCNEGLSDTKYTVWGLR